MALHYSQRCKSNAERMVTVVLPVTIAPLVGKYYGTRVLDAYGDVIATFWHPVGEPSEREKSRFRDWTPEAWAEWICDEHWESVSSYAAASAFCAHLNGDEPIPMSF